MMDRPGSEEAPTADELSEILATRQSLEQVRARTQRVRAAEEVSGHRVLTGADVARLPSPSWAIHDVWPLGGITMLVGERGLGKSLLALDWVASIAAETCEDWQGHAIDGWCAGLYVALEGFYSGARQRLQAWEAVRGHLAQELYWWPDSVNLRDPQDVKAVVAAAEVLEARRVVIDSARAAGAGAEDTKDMGAMVQGLEQIRADARSVLVLHNTGWDVSRPRGSTLLPDVCDTVLLLERQGSTLRLSNTKQRDAPGLEEPVYLVTSAVPGIGGVVLEATSAPGKATALEVALLAVVGQQPGLQTGELAQVVEHSRPEVSKTLAALTEAGAVANQGPRQRPAWVLTSERS